ncbi:hypothetical protein HU200_003631 [Digitaria exilis]|uniref:Uncharacterized protein n=1 Tax=Digitaria exilis TaxID=1010633 RepID=A0A835FTS9_9POAL|nr:hypothetical protein HU200_003631 [Digitaria exilis]
MRGRSRGSGSFPPAINTKAWFIAAILAIGFSDSRSAMSIWKSAHGGVFSMAIRANGEFFQPPVQPICSAQPTMWLAALSHPIVCLVRKLELLVALLVFVMAACFFIEMSIVKPPSKEVIRGLFVPSLSGPGATGDTIALLGALVMPHNLFLHSALVLSRNTPSSVKGIKDACRFFLFESGIALFVALTINICIVSVSGIICNSSSISPDDSAKCSDITLDSSSFLLRVLLVITGWSPLFG